MGKLVSPDKPNSYRCIRDGFQWDLTDIGLDPSKFSLLSLCSVGATSTANNGVSFSVMTTGSLLRRGTFTLTIASSNDSHFLSVWIFNCFPCAQYFVALACLGWFLSGPAKINLFGYLLCFPFVLKWRQNMLFLMNELANKAKRTILSARESTRPGSRPVHHGQRESRT